MHCHTSENTEPEHRSLIEKKTIMLILEEKWKQHLEAFASELFISQYYSFYYIFGQINAALVNKRDINIIFLSFS